MCLILLALDSHPDYSLVVAANRDEFYDRPTAPAAFWSDAPSVLAGRDLKAGGTWLGVDRRGRFAAVTNYRQGSRESEAPRSRGHLVSDFLTGSADPREYVERVERDAQLYNGFNLIAGTPRELFYYSNRDGQARSLERGIYGLSNHLLDSDWPKVTSAKSGLSALLEERSDELIPRLFTLLSDRRQAEDDLLPETGVGPEWERLLSSAFIVSDGYGTRSSTVLLVARNGVVTLVERSFSPGGAPAGEVRYQLDTAAAVSTSGT
jgi:uncharacterized protein with NRDE domain